ncbi:ABC transporter ATP-binding protein [Plebeiibacterium marinum]|uniref:ABC transporter ATP-binding protein n=1 Tax=Plebeiibacterium marinum TaxID=2992111 RepID=A0AAE3SIP3_9BACT|nr:ABC transporter ATP-binding protein [Plebeiobacterium marinum]MCW3804653.1 ABC transporter ATP-binding protein [Plebeiobacterium marinum]
MIQINKLNFSYNKKKELYKDLCFKAQEGNIIGLLGKNGAGKSTLLKLMAGLLKPKSGEISVFGHTPFSRNPDFLADVFFVHEELHIPPVTIRCYTSALSSLYPKFNTDKLYQLIESFELDKNANLSKLSYGQKKKFIIAFALSTNCKLLLLDEPTNGLDIPSKAQFRKVLAGAITEEQNVIISTHQVRDIENLIDRVVVIDNGKEIFNQNTFEISKNFSFMSSPAIDDDVFYYEIAPGGYNVLKPKNGVETAIDLELLFNALINGTKLETNATVL